MIGEKTNTIFRHTLSTVFALIVFFVSVQTTSTELHRLMPGQYPIEGLFLFVTMLMHPTLHPIYFIYLTPALLYAVAIHQLMFLTTSGSIYGFFHKGGTKSIGLAGTCIVLGVLGAHIDPVMLGEYYGGPIARNLFSWTGADIVLVLTGSWMGTVASNGLTLFRHAQTLRSKLDEVT